MRISLQVLGFTFLCLMGAAKPVQAQVLAQKNWAGSGVTVEPWWRRAVFYRIDPAKFQDSDDDGKGDLAGVAQRLDYLQSLDVDALILDPGTETQPDAALSLTEPGFDDLVRAAVGHHLRVIVALGAPASQAMASDQQYLALARSWLNQGAAGVYVPTLALQKVDGTGHIAILLHQLRLLTNSFPGGRVLIAGAPANADIDLAKALLKETQLTASAPITAGTPTAAAMPHAAALRLQLGAALAGPPGAPSENARGETAVNPLLLAARISPLHDADTLERTEAAMLLASRAAVILEAGQELGLATVDGRAPVMQWTPSNITPKPAPPPEPKAAEAPVEPKAAYEGFHPFIAPPRKDLLPAPKMPVIVVSDDPQPAVIEPNTLPGFTGGALDASTIASNAATANVATEQADAKSLLSLYKQLIHLHHDNSTIRNGTQMLLDRDTEDALAWVRRAPAGVRTSASVVVVCRLGGVVDTEIKVGRDLIGTSRDVIFVGEGRF